MLIGDITSINVEEFKSIFEKKFTSFCEKAPLYLTYKIIGNLVEVKDMTQKEIWEKQYELDFSRTEKWNVKCIKDDLEKRYPKIRFIYDKPLADEKATKLISEGYRIEEVMDMSEKEEVEKYKIIKILNDNNELIIRDLENGEEKLLGSKVPVVTIMEKILERKHREVQRLFETKTYLKKIL